jgi:SAM-dependent methyltransferase
MTDTNRWLPPEAFTKSDCSNDAAFYSQPRLVNHIDEAAVAALRRFYGVQLPISGRILDLMSSWVSHLPPSVVGEVVGHGMNTAELAANPRLSNWVVRDLNAQPTLPFDTESFDAAVCCVGVQYLQQPNAVFADVTRVLRPGSPCIISFSNRCFPTKAVAVWRALDGTGHGELVSMYLQRSGFERVAAYVLCDGMTSDPLTAVIGYRTAKIDASAVKPLLMTTKATERLLLAKRAD